VCPQRISGKQAEIRLKVDVLLGINIIPEIADSLKSKAYKRVSEELHTLALGVSPWYITLGRSGESTRKNS
jgi:hypothetical protein